MRNTKYEKAGQSCPAFVFRSDSVSYFVAQRFVISPLAE